MFLCLTDCFKRRFKTIRHGETTRFKTYFIVLTVVLRHVLKQPRPPCESFMGGRKTLVKIRRGPAVVAKVAFTSKCLPNNLGHWIQNTFLCLSDCLKTCIKNNPDRLHGPFSGAAQRWPHDGELGRKPAVKQRRR